MARQAKELESSFTVDFVAIAEDEAAAWRADLLLLWQLLKAERLMCVCRAHWVGISAHGQQRV